jgi:RNA recognition motif-containing protein
MSVQIKFLGRTMKTIYVGNINYNASAEELKELFSQYGEVLSAKIINDRETGRSKGFGFIDMESGAETAIEELDGKEFQGRRLRVNEARPREARA